MPTAEAGDSEGKGPNSVQPTVDQATTDDVVREGEEEEEDDDDIPWQDVQVVEEQADGQGARPSLSLQL